MDPQPKQAGGHGYYTTELATPRLRRWGEGVKGTKKDAGSFSGQKPGFSLSRRNK